MPWWHCSGREFLRGFRMSRSCSSNLTTGRGSGAPVQTAPNYAAVISAGQRGPGAGSGVVAATSVRQRALFAPSVRDFDAFRQLSRRDLASKNAVTSGNAPKTRWRWGESNPRPSASQWDFSERSRWRISGATSSPATVWRPSPVSVRGGPRAGPKRKPHWMAPLPGPQGGGRSDVAAI